MMLMMLPAQADVPICWASVKLCFMVEGTLFFSFLFHPASFTVIFLHLFLFLSSSSTSASLIIFHTVVFDRFSFKRRCVHFRFTAG